MFAKSVINDIFIIPKIFGPEAVTFLSNDDKTRNPLDLDAATLETPILMHLGYKVKLPNHSFVATPAHKPIYQSMLFVKSHERGRYFTEETLL